MSKDTHEAPGFGHEGVQLVRHPLEVPFDLTQPLLRHRAHVTVHLRTNMELL